MRAPYSRSRGVNEVIFAPQIVTPGPRELMKELPGFTRYEISTVPLFLLMLATLAKQ